MNKVFIGMPVYNGERFIREAINSIRDQSYSNWDMVISDDASTDGTEKICREYSEKDSRIKYVRQPINLGMFDNFKYVLDCARGDYFMWMAQDDIREKDYIKVCVEKLDSDNNISLATTCVGAIDSSGKTSFEELEVARLSGNPGIVNVSKYILQPEILGKCNIMYGIFRIDTARSTWDAYPQRNTWGQDYLFSLACISRFGVFVDKRVFFKKRFGGFSNPTGFSKDTQDATLSIKLRKPKNGMFPFKRFSGYFNGHMEALRGTPYRPLAAILLLLRLPRSLFLYLKERNVRKFINNLTKKI